MYVKTTEIHHLKQLNSVTGKNSNVLKKNMQIVNCKKTPMVKWIIDQEQGRLNDLS